MSFATAAPLPPPTPADFAAVLEELATDPRGPSGPADTGFADWVRSSLASAGTKLRVQAFEEAHRPAGRAARTLDVGAQIGSLSLLAAHRGFEAAAVDQPSYAERFSAVLADRGVDYRKCDLRTEPLPFPEGHFDFVTYLDVIEHHSFSPRRVLREIHRVLAPGGHVIVTTPNHTSLYNRVSLLLGRSVLDNFDYYFETCEGLPTYPGHHRELTRDELRRALSSTGFAPVAVRVDDEDPRTLLYSLRHNPAARKWRSVAELGLASAGQLWSGLRLPFGRILWGVGQKPVAA